MKKILGRKQRMDNTRWIDAAGRIGELVTEDELNQAIKIAKDARFCR